MERARGIERVKATIVLAVLALASCDGGDEPRQSGRAESEPSVGWDVVQDSSRRLGSIEGFAGPESVRYDPDQDVWFVSNWNGDGDVRDGNGFVSRVSAETSEVEALRFAEGTPEHPLHAPRGLCIVGDTLWAVDVDGVHGFDRRTGEAVAFVDLAPFAPGFLNDVAQGPDGALYVTDTGMSSVYRIVGRTASVAVADSALGGPNGIAWDPTRELLVTAPWNPGFGVRTWRPGEDPVSFGPGTTPGRLDGIEPYGRRLLIASQSDSSIMVMDGGETWYLIRLPGPPADIGVDTRRRRIAVPYVDLNRVDVWRLPG